MEGSIVQQLYSATAFETWLYKGLGSRSSRVRVTEVVLTTVVYTITTSQGGLRGPVGPRDFFNVFPPPLAPILMFQPLLCLKQSAFFMVF